MCLYATSVFVWVPKGTYINLNYEQELINNLTEGNLFKAFATAFMLDHLPSDVDSSFSNEWENYYYDRVRNLPCSACKAHFDLSVPVGTFIFVHVHLI